MEGFRVLGFASAVRRLDHEGKYPEEGQPLYCNLTEHPFLSCGGVGTPGIPSFFVGGVAYRASLPCLWGLDLIGHLSFLVGLGSYWASFFSCGAWKRQKGLKGLGVEGLKG